MTVQRRSERAAERVVVITGGSRGIGARLVTQCLDQGWAVCFTYSSDAASAEQLAEQGGGSARVLAMRADVSDEAAMRGVFTAAASMGPVTAWVNNAGITGRIRGFGSVPISEARRVIDVNLLGTIIGCQVALENWRADPAGKCIVNVSSIAATLGAPNEYIPYAAAKAGIETLTVGLAKELGPSGIRVNAVRPGTTHTDIHALAGDPARATRVASRIPLERAAQPEEISAAIIWLMSAEASYVTGTVLQVAGGL